jgi:predicted transglutaminase-like cysteine proteinase
VISITKKQHFENLAIAGCFALLLFGVAANNRAVTLFDWMRMEQLASERYGDTAQRAVADWQVMIQSAVSSTTREQLLAVNDFFNERVRWTTDQALFGQSDYWATPLEILGRSAGDCEDFSIAKYVSLLALGVPAGSLRLVYVKAQRPGLAPQAHMVLAWYETPTATPLILDNINTALLPADQRPDLVPVFSFNHTDLWIGSGGRRSGKDPQTRMARWQQVLRRIEAEGMTINN